MKKLIIALTVAILAAGAAFWLLRAESDEGRIRAVLQELCRTASKSAGETAAAGFLKVQKLDQLFAPKCRIDVQHQFVDGNLAPEEIGAMILRYRPLFTSVDLHLRDISVEVAPDRKSATANFTGIVRGTIKKDHSQINESRDLFCRLQKRNDRWLVTEIAIREVLEK